MDDWMGFGTLLVTVAGFGLALVMLVRSMRKSNDAAHAKTEQHIRDLDAKNEAAHAKTEQHVRDLDAKNEAAHAGIRERIDASRAEVLGQVQALDAKNTAKLDAIARDVAFLAGRQKERDHRDGG